MVPPLEETALSDSKKWANTNQAWEDLPRIAWLPGQFFPSDR